MGSAYAMLSPFQLAYAKQDAARFCELVKIEKPGAEEILILESGYKTKPYAETILKIKSGDIKVSYYVGKSFSLEESDGRISNVSETADSYSFGSTKIEIVANCHTDSFLESDFERIKDSYSDFVSEWNESIDNIDTGYEFTQLDGELLATSLMATGIGYISIEADKVFSKGISGTQKNVLKMANARNALIFLRSLYWFSGSIAAASAGYSLGSWLVEKDENHFDGKMLLSVGDFLDKVGVFPAVKYTIESTGKVKNLVINFMNKQSPDEKRIHRDNCVQITLDEFKSLSNSRTVSEPKYLLSTSDNRNFMCEKQEYVKCENLTEEEFSQLDNDALKNNGGSSYPVISATDGPQLCEKVGGAQ